MKRIEEIDKEIDDQISMLNQKGIEPKILLIGDMAYYNLKVSNPDKLEKVSNVGTVLKSYKGLRVIQRPSFESGGCFKKEHELIEVFGS